ncbi:Rrf2 family transcriptional regulator [Caminibacter mediatlanticus TB-2]|uniref:Rrf2 family transcriptional regulator n=1 Tax=Caminibacter mediatlanticus TB-2 TaxID=391592 RepID=A0AAI9AIK5_9BACT|nr:Rrf2 family transcriptional regulator [Caminibacter mediatlanticus]EDM24195.1 transcriptional regulator, BadM/Rrf2 family protein [Caminibacter mediatlanticus TB-2]QCT94843.1 Rrf2 family transcriptional regulator [Caminibacter mediatlanticus TB-2]
MLFTKSTAYALQALIELSKYDKPIDVTTISEKTAIPKPFLAKLLQNLSRNGFVYSFKGINGGFVLAKNPKEIKLLDIFKNIEDKDTLVFYCSKSKDDCTRNRGSICELQPFFEKMEDEIAIILDKYTLADFIRN